MIDNDLILKSLSSNIFLIKFVETSTSMRMDHPTHMQENFY